MIFYVACVISMLGFSAAGFAQGSPAKHEVNDKTLKSLKALAWASLPTRIVLADKRVVEIDKSDALKIVIPDEEAREIVRGAYLTARAHRCDLQEAVILNRDAILKREKAKNKWTESQLHYINALHLYTVQLLVGKIEAVDTDKVKPEFDPKSNPPMPPAAISNCSEQEKQEILTAVEANEKLVGKS